MFAVRHGLHTCRFTSWNFQYLASPETMQWQISLVSHQSHCRAEQAIFRCTLDWSRSPTSCTLQGLQQLKAPH